MKQKNLENLLFSAAGVGIMFGILMAANIIFGVVRTRIDLTEEKLYTLSDGTRAILAKLDTPVKIRFYCTRGENAMPVQLKTYAQRVEDLLTEYAQAAKGKITIEKLDPQPDSDAEESASLDGVDGQTLDLTTKVYLGLAVSCLDAKEAIPFLAPDRERLLEYDLSRAIARVITPEKPVIGAMSVLPIFGQPMNPMMMRMGQQGQEPWIFMSELKRDFDVRQIETTTDKIDDDIKVLLVIHPRDLPESAQFAIDQFLLRGGKLAVFLDPLSIADNRNTPMNPMQRATASGSSLDRLTKAWGIEFDAGRVVADMNFVSRLRGQNGQPQAAPAVLSLTPDAINADDVVSSQLDNLLVPYPGGFTGTPAAGLTQTVLLRTSSDAQLVDKMMAEFSGEQVARDFKGAGKQYSLAVRLAGKFKSAFPDGKPAAKPEAQPGEEPKKPDAASGEALKESAKESAVILVADTDLLYDPVVGQVQNLFGQRIVIPQNQNLTLVQSIVEQLAGDNNLIGVRSRATLNRPFTVVKKIQNNAEENYRSKIRDLEASLSDTQQKLNELQKTKQQGQRFILSPEQQAEVANFRKKEAEMKRELKEVRKQLRRDIDSLENRLKWINIAGMPLLVTVSGISLAVMKRKRTAAK